MTSYAIEALPDPATKRRNTLFSRLLSPAPEFDLSCIGEDNRPEVEVFVKQKFKQSYSANINEFFPDLLCMRCFGKLTGTAGMRVANNSKLFLEQYLDQAIETELSALNNKTVSRDSIVEIGNLASSQRGASHLLFLLFTSILHRAGYRWIVFTATKSLQNNLNKLGFELSYLCNADPSKLDNDSVEDWGKYYDTEPQVVAGDLDNAMNIIQTRPLYRRILRLYNHQINYMTKEFKAAQHD
jgi:hypothetical protein